MKTCKQCGETKPDKDFPVSFSTYKSILKGTLRAYVHHSNYCNRCKYLRKKESEFRYITGL